VLLEELVRTSADVAQTSSRRAKVARLAACLELLRPNEIEVAVAYLSGELPHGPIGVGWASLREPPPAASAPGTLEVLQVDARLRRIGAIAGTGSQARRHDELEALFAAATEPEQAFLARLLVGELRQGALEGVMADAIAHAAGLPAPDVRRAAMLAGDLRAVAVTALTEGEQGLRRFGLTLLRPVQPMLAQTARDLADALKRITPAAVEWKLDGARIQAHRLGGEVRVFTRNLADITDRVPEVVECMLGLPPHALVLDGEAIALEPNRRPRPFQVTMSRFGSKLDVDELRRRVPLSVFFFDCLHIDGADLLDRSSAARASVLAECVPGELRVPRLVTDDAGEAQQFLEHALAQGHEGVMVKALDALYEAGRRGAVWLKVKPAHTLDLVVLAAEWGHGRRRGRLSNLHLGARDPDAGSFVMLGKTFKGMTDEMLAWQTERLLELETRRDSNTVYVQPRLVVEVAFDGVQASSRYPGGVALRFARVKGYRADKSPEDADTIETVRAIRSEAR
jgi:DNA ligase-1